MCILALFEGFFHLYQLYCGFYCNNVLVFLCVYIFPQLQNRHSKDINFRVLSTLMKETLIYILARDSSYIKYVSFQVPNNLMRETFISNWLEVETHNFYKVDSEP